MPYRPGDPTCEFEGRIEFQTPKAYLVEPTLGPKQIWVPKSQCVTVGEPDANGNRAFEVTEWWVNNSDMKGFAQ